MLLSANMQTKKNIKPVLCAWVYK